MKKRVFSRALDDPESLVELLVARAQLDPEDARERIASGAVYIGRERATTPRSVLVGDKVTLYNAAVTVVAPAPVAVLHRDDWIVVLDKPAGMPSQAERSQRAAALDAWAERAFGGATRLMHRLDKEASGLVLCATRAEAYAPLQAALAEGKIEREYIAVVDGELRNAGTIKLRIARHSTDQRLRAALPEHAPAGEAACSHWRALAHGEIAGQPITALALRLETGRAHQLRVHLAGMGHPIVGDVAYGGRAHERMCLHAQALELPHPRDHRRLRVHSPLPVALACLVPGLTRPLT